jgi:transcriptional regulator with XRE-family HTH domain
MDDAREIGLRIRKIRDRKGISQKDLAKTVRISAGYLSQMELGERNIDATMLLKIAFVNNIASVKYELKGVAW